MRRRPLPNEENGTISQLTVKRRYSKMICQRLSITRWKYRYTYYAGWERILTSSSPSSSAPSCQSARARLPNLVHLREFLERVSEGQEKDYRHQQ